MACIYWTCFCFERNDVRVMLPEEDEATPDELAKANQEYYDDTDENGEYSDNEGNYEVNDQEPRDTSFRDRQN